MSDESDSTIELNRRRVLAGLGTIGVASAGAGAGTFALFSDTETSSGNTVQAGTLDLSLGGGSASTTLSVPDVKPGDSGTAALTLDNTGSVDGFLDVGVTNVSASGGTDSDNYTQDRYTTAYGAGRNDNLVSIERATGNSGEVETTVSKSGGTITVESSAPFNVSIYNLQFDIDGDGFIDANIIYQPGSSADSNGDGFVYKTPSSSDGLAVSKQDLDADNPSIPNVQDVTFDASTNAVAVDLNASAVAEGSGAAFGGNVKPASTNSRYPNGNTDASKDWFGNFSVPIVPGGSSYGPEFNSWGGGLVPLDTTGGRNLADLAELTLSLSPTSSQSSNVKLVSDESADLGDGSPTAPVAAATGKPSRIEREFNKNYEIDAGETHHLFIEYELPQSTGNAVQGESLTFDVELSLTQEGAQ